MFERARLIVAGLSGGSGKTILSLGLCRHWKLQGHKVKPFKKGPDYIDAAWLALASEQYATNLDPFLMPADQVEGLFWEQSHQYDLSVIEGNRGLFDGKDIQGSCSTAELARLLKCPVILVIDCTKMTRTVAALVQGCQAFAPDVHLAGVIFNRTAGDRHRSILRNCVEKYTDVPVLGALPKLKENPIPERHMGLISNYEYEAETGLNAAAEVVSQWIDCSKIEAIARFAPPVKSFPSVNWPVSVQNAGPVKIGVVKDAALWFYYQENIEALRRAGADIVEVNLFSREPWPTIHGLYLGGGFPETQAEALAANTSIKNHILNLSRKGLPIYAECGGLMYLGQEIECKEHRYSMTGIFPFITRLCAKPQGHGYTEVKVQRENPFYPVGLQFPGHEFHYSKLINDHADDNGYLFQMVRGHGIMDGKDGLLQNNTFASYTHMHALGVPKWAPNFVLSARRFKDHMENGTSVCPSIIAG